MSNQTYAAKKWRCVYVLIDPRDDSVFYVGQTTSIQHRLSDHIGPVISELHRIQDPDDWEQEGIAAWSYPSQTPSKRMVEYIKARKHDPPFLSNRFSPKELRIADIMIQTGDVIHYDIFWEGVCTYGEACQVENDVIDWAIDSGYNLTNRETRTKKKLGLPVGGGAMSKVPTLASIEARHNP